MRSARLPTYQVGYLLPRESEKLSLRSLLSTSRARPHRTTGHGFKRCSSLEYDTINHRGRFLITQAA